MIGKLQGIVDLIGESELILNVRGVGYQIFTSRKALSSLSLGDGAEFYIETHVREDHIHLYGFLTFEEKAWFNLLTSVQGVGNKVGLAILSSANTTELLTAITAQDKTVFTQISGIGPKLGDRIITELKDKVLKTNFTPYFENKADIDIEQIEKKPSKKPEKSLKSKNTSSEKDSQKTNQNIITDTVSALVNLGYKKFQAYEAASKAYNSIEDKNQVDMQGLIKEALKHLSRF